MNDINLQQIEWRITPHYNSSGDKYAATCRLITLIPDCEESDIC